MRQLLGHTKTILAAGVLILVGLILAPVPAGAQDPITVDVDAVADSIEASGSYLELGYEGEEAAAIDRANAANVAFVSLDRAGDADAAAKSIITELGSRQSRYGAVVVLTRSGVWSSGVDAATDALDDATVSIFGSGNVAGGLDTFVNRLGGAAGAGAPSTGGGFPWIVPILLAIVLFVGFRLWSGRRKTKTAENKAIEDDRAEIKEQLKNNADRVIDYGDRVISSGDATLIAMYEEASRTYQDVSQSVNDAMTATEVDLLDDRIDKAEWQFDVIEAKLEGRTPPPFPYDEMEAPGSLEGTPPPPPPSGRLGDRSQRRPDPREGSLGGRRESSAGRNEPALGHDESVFDRSRPQTQETQGREPQRRQSRRRSGGGMGGLLTGGMGRMLMSVLASVLLGGGLGRPRTSRRTRRRTGGDLGSILGGGSRSSGGFGSLGGGILKRR